MRIERLKAFSDGVFAILITILVLEFKVPEYEPGHLLTAAINQWPILVAYLMSFLYVGTLWLFHHDYFDTIEFTDTALNSINLAILFSITLINYPTSLLSETVSTGNQADMRVAFMLYGFVALVISLLFEFLYLYVGSHRELKEHTPMPEAFYRSIKYDPIRSVVIYALAIVLTYFWVPIGALLILFGIIFHFVAYIRLGRLKKQFLRD